MKKITTRLLAAALIFTMTSGLVISCTGNNTSDVTTTTTTTASTTTTTTTTTTTSKKTDDSKPSTGTTAGDKDDPNVGQTTTSQTLEDVPDVPVVSQGEGVDLILFIGQSNMAGRGASGTATKVEQGHAYEFRAISDPTKLYHLTEPFGVNENNAASGVTESKKTGSMVSAFCESLYSVTGTPIVAVSCSKGGEKISFFDTSTKVYADAVNRMNLAKDFLQKEYESGKTQFKLKNVFVVWLQGESDGDAGNTASAYNATLARIVNGFKKDLNCAQTFIIPIGTYNGNDGARKAKYNTIRDAQFLFCEDNDDATVVSRQTVDLYRYGYMKDQFHFNQAGYNILGKDAGANAGYFIKYGKKPVCLPYYEEQETVRTNGAWQEKDGKVVIPASAAMELSTYASYSSAAENHSWAKTTSGLDGIKQTNGNGTNWATLAYAFKDAPQVHYTFNITSPGRYYLYMLTSHPDTGSNSVYASIDGGKLIECANNSYGAGLWMSNEAWCFDIESAGDHTVHIYAREDGVILNQIVLSKNKSESFTKGVAETVSARNSYTTGGMYVEVNGTVSINLSDALDNTTYAYNKTGKADNMSDVFRWERSVAHDGVQAYPDKGISWSANSISPRLSYEVYFSTPGVYYVTVYSSFKSSTADSFYISLDNGAIVTCSNSIATGVGKWLSGEAWKITVPYAGVHTVNIFPREDGCILHKLVLTNTTTVWESTTDALRLPSDPTDSYTVTDGCAVVDVSADNVTTFKVTFDKAGKYYFFLSADAAKDAVLTLEGLSSALNFKFAENSNAWIKAFELNITKAQQYTFKLSCSESVSPRLVCIMSDELYTDITDGVETLFIGDSYTSTVAWRNFEEETESIGGLTIGIGGTQYGSWLKNINNYTIYDPKNIVIHIGVNDINNGKLTGEVCAANIISLITELQKNFPNAKIFYVSICDNESNKENWGKYKTSNDLVKAHADKTDNVYYVDFATPFKAVNQSMTDLGFRDKLHLNEEGYVLFSKIICEAVIEANK